MKLENKKQKVAKLPHFFFRVGSYMLVSLLLITLSMAIGTWGYRYIAHLSWIDSFYMAAMILTGMGPVSEMKTDAAKLFSAFYALYSGVAFLSMVGIFFAPIIHRLLHILHVEYDET
jgi:hypothetical protein